MSFLFTRVTMNHLRLMSLGIVVLAIAWILIAWFLSADRIWVVPGIFLLFTGVVKFVGVQVWDRMSTTDSSETR